MTQINPILNHAQLSWANHTPKSDLFDDYYYSKDDGIAESKYVYLQANHLRQRWASFEQAAKTRFCILETGFGTGLNFLLTAQYWLDYQAQAQPQYLRQLHYSSIEAYPLRLADLKRVIDLWPRKFDLTPLLLDLHPQAISGIYNFNLIDEKINLNLLFMPAAQALNQLEPSAQRLFDCIYLDGFAPAKNHQMWREPSLRQIAGYCKSGASFSSFTAAASVRHTLTHAGFDVKKIKGFGRKREMLTGVLNHPVDQQARTKAPWFKLNQSKVDKTQPIAIIGAGVAGCATAWALARRGYPCILFDSAAQLGGTIAHSPASIYGPFISADFNIASQFYWHAHLQLAHFLSQTPGVEYKNTGIAHIAHTRDRQRIYQAFLKQIKQIETGINWIDENQTFEKLGLQINHPCLYLPQGGWLNNKSLCNQLVKSELISLRLNTEITAIVQHKQKLQLSSPEKCFAAQKLIICSGHQTRLIDDYALCEWDKIKGQLSQLEWHKSLSNLGCVISNGHYIIPPTRSGHFITIGATYEHDYTAIEQLTHAAKSSNLSALKGINAQLDQLLHEQCTTTGQAIKGSSGCRLATKDRMPLIGPVPNLDFYQQHYPAAIKTGRLKGCPDAQYIDNIYLNTAHGSRGVTASILSANLIAAMLDRDLLPLPKRLMQAVHPARFFVREQR